MPSLSVLSPFPRLATGLQLHGNAAFVAPSVCADAVSGQAPKFYSSAVSKNILDAPLGHVAMERALPSLFLPPEDLWAYIMGVDECTLKSQ